MQRAGPGGPARFVSSRLNMQQSRTTIVAAAALLAAALPAPGWAQAAAAPAKVQILCANCHGVDGVSTLPGAPNLSGQQREYLVVQLRAYRSGSRQEAQMNVVAKTLSDADIASVAAWYAGIKVTVELPK